MVKLGFIVEGETEKIILEQSDFFAYLRSLPVEYISDVIDAQGNGNLLPHNIVQHTDVLRDKGATHIFILTDLDEDECITNTKQRIAAPQDHIVIVSVKEIESWFLADTTVMKKFLKDESFSYESPEIVEKPYEEMRAIRIAKLNRGFNGKPFLAKIMVTNGFSISRAAQHPNCNSAKYFLKKIDQVVQTK